MTFKIKDTMLTHADFLEALNESGKFSPISNIIGMVRHASIANKILKTGKMVSHISIDRENQYLVIHNGMKISAVHQLQDWTVAHGDPMTVFINQIEDVDDINSVDTHPKTVEKKAKPIQKTVKPLYDQSDLFA